MFFSSLMVLHFLLVGLAVVLRLLELLVLAGYNLEITLWALLHLYVSYFERK